MHSAVDNETEAAIQRSLEKIIVNRTTIAIAHRLSTIRNADCIYVMEYGQLVEAGKHEQLLEKASPSLQCFNQPLIEYLSQTVTVLQYSFYQNQDEASCLDTAVLALYDYIQSLNRAFHLISHGTAGLIGLLYTCRYPETVQSLTLLAVGVDAAVNWRGTYYEHRAYKSRDSILNAMVYNLFGYQDKCTVKMLERIFELRAIDNAIEK